MPNTASPTRRILSDKPTNAHLRVSGTTNKMATTAESTTVTSPRLFVKATVAPSNPSSRSPRAGQKRRIEEVEDHEQHGSQDSNVTQPLSQVSGEGSEMVNRTVEDGEVVGQAGKLAPYALLPSFNASQEVPNPLEDEFEIQEEMSQRTLDKMHAITLPQNSSQPEPLSRPSLSKELSGLSQMTSMSSFIDYGSSQDSDNLESLEVAKAEEKRRKEMLVEKAAALRTRLQLALFKVETNQVSRPFDRLQVPKPPRSSSSSPELRPATLVPPHLTLQPTNIFPSKRQYLSQVTSHTRPTPALSLTATSQQYSSQPQPCYQPYHQSHQSQQQHHSPESQIASARTRATAQVKPSVKPLSSIPMPRIAPTSFSARWVDENINSNSDSDPDSHNPRRDRSSQDTIQLPMPLSSPPLSNPATSRIHTPEDEAEHGKVTTSKSGSGSAEGEGEVTPRASIMNKSTANAAAAAVPLLSRSQLDGPTTWHSDDSREPVQLSSPPVSDAGADSQTQSTRHDARISKQDSKGIDISPMKGEAATGLLELMTSDPARPRARR